MRAVPFVLVTAAIVWIAVAREGAPRRADGGGGAVPGLELPEAAPPVPPEEAPVAVVAEPCSGVEIVVAAAAPDGGMPVEIVLVDGESGDALSATTTTVPRGPEAVIDFRVSAPAGYVAEASERKLTAHVSRRAERLRAIEPLRREADTRVRIFDAVGAPVRGACVTALYLGDTPWVAENPATFARVAMGLPIPVGPSGQSSSDGWLRVRGVPHLLDERFHIEVGHGDLVALGAIVLRDLGETHEIEIRLPAKQVNYHYAAIGLGGGAGGGKAGRGGRRTHHTPAALEVVVRFRDGRIGAGLDVHAGAVHRTTDALGRVAFERLPPGTYTVDVRDPDFVWSKESVALGGGDRRTLVLSEPEGWTASAVLHDSMGRPVPFAKVTVASEAPVPCVHVEDGIQDLALWTDKHGGIRLRDLHRAPVKLTFEYGSRRASVTLSESEPHATARLPPP